MTKVRVAGFSISLDGFGAGPEQSLENPLGKRGMELHRWLFGTRMFQAMIGKDGGSDGVDQAYAHHSMDGFGAFILGRNMFGPIRGHVAGRELEEAGGATIRPITRRPSCMTHHPRDPIADGRRHHLHLRDRTVSRRRWTRRNKPPMVAT